MLLLDGEDALDAAGGWWDRRCRASGRSPVGVDRHPLGDQVLLDHVDQRVAVVVLGVAPRLEAGRVEVGLALQLGDALGDLVGVLLLVVGVLEELGGQRRWR